MARVPSFSPWRIGTSPFETGGDRTGGPVVRTRGWIHPRKPRIPIGKSEGLCWDHGSFLKCNVVLLVIWNPASGWNSNDWVSLESAQRFVAPFGGDQRMQKVPCFQCSVWVSQQPFHQGPSVSPTSHGAVLAMSTLAAGMALHYNSRTKVGKTQRKVGKFLKKLLKPGANTVDLVMVQKSGVHHLRLVV